jgi:phage gpG-like protein
MNINDLLNDIFLEVKSEVEESIDNNFRSESFFGAKWPLAVHKKVGQGLLVDTARLRRSITLSVNTEGTRISSDVPYADIHNSGGVIPVTPGFRRMAWAKFKESQKADPQGVGDVFFKNLALTKKTSITIPQRQFVGDHPKLDEEIDNIVFDNVKPFIDNLVRQRFRV